MKGLRPYFQGVHEVLDEEEPPQLLQSAVHVELQAVRVLLDLLLGQGDLELQVGPGNRHQGAPQRDALAGCAPGLAQGSSCL